MYQYVLYVVVFLTIKFTSPWGREHTIYQVLKTLMLCKLDSEFLSQSMKIGIPVKKCINISMPDFRIQLNTLLAKLFQCIKYKL